MSAGLFGLLDDVAAIAKMAAASVDDVGAAAGKATAKAAGVVIDDTAVTPQYVQGVAATRELPIVKKIAIGSIRNKLLIILPVSLLLSEFLPDLLPIILMIGGTFLAYEGAHKIWHMVTGHDEHEAPVAEVGADAERELVAGAIRTDLILSAEIMVIALASVEDEGFWTKLGTLFVVAIVITVAVYGVVALIVKMDDAGLSLAQRSSAFAQKVGRGLVAAMPRLLSIISIVGTVAMLWVGGHILLVNVHEVGWWDAPYTWVHGIEHDIEHAVHGVVGSALAWLANTGISAVIGLVVGSVVVAVVRLLPFSGDKDPIERYEDGAPAPH
ncbi:DUF808 domain-containing protein [Nocardioides daeguensis]|uniref:DUF808 domain-containing protein n=1 Tax=Nocardioides daeguensis TaxID=908359 RepID=A0ABP6WKL7_9ACTN|nr:DUF808 domain-containing protein [Nocardioides daeguensis]MBV6729033.1 DUF808 domain-containing protein [Nocardioides daeguensis]MCR1774963.1 DUF808 domain-containing protein [Nocardioides daeguensis]